MKTFNYDGTEKQHLGEQRYSICVRQEAGKNCNRPNAQDLLSFVCHYTVVAS